MQARKNISSPKCIVQFVILLQETYRKLSKINPASAIGILGFGTIEVEIHLHRYICYTKFWNPIFTVTVLT